jgi:hypothetical protein
LAISAFNNVHHLKLFHNLKKRKIPGFLVKLIKSFLQDRSTRIKFNGTTLSSLLTPAGIPQGSPLSPIFYIYYNADLLDIQVTGALTPHLSLGFIDDIGYGVKRITSSGNIAKLTEILVEAEHWRQWHGAQFETSKYLLIHFTWNKRDYVEAALMIDGTTISLSKVVIYLGVMFDSELKYRAHTDIAVKKGMKFRLAIGAIARAT